MAEANLALRAARRRLGLTQAQLARQAGISAETLHNAESGRKSVARETLLRIARAANLDPNETNAVLAAAGHDAEAAGRLAEIARRRRPLEALQDEVAGYDWPCLVMNERHEIACWNDAANRVAELDFARDLPQLRDRSLMLISTMQHFRDRVQNWEQIISVLIAVLKANQTDIEHPEADSAYFAALVAEVARLHPDIFPQLLGLWARVEPRGDGGREGFPAIWRIQADGTLLRFNCLISSWSDFDAAWAFDWHPADATTWNWLRRGAAGGSAPPAAAPGELPRPLAVAARTWRELLRQERAAAGLSRAKLARRSAVSASAIESLEAPGGPRQRAPRRETLLRLTRAMELDGIATNAILEAAGLPAEPSEWALFLANEPRRTDTRKYRPKNDPHKTRFDIQRAIANHTWPCLIIDERCELLCWNAPFEQVHGGERLRALRAGGATTIVRYLFDEAVREQMVNWAEAVSALIPGSLRPFLGGERRGRGGQVDALLAAVRWLDPESLRRLQAVWATPPQAKPQTRVVFPLVWRASDGQALSFDCLLSPWSAFDPYWALDWHPADAVTWEWLAARA